MQFFTLCHQILSILTIHANIGSCPRTTLPLPHGLFHFAPFSRLATSRWVLAIFFFFFFLSFVVILIMAVLKVLQEVTACIYEGEEKPMKCSSLTKVENKELKSFLQTLQ